MNRSKGMNGVPKSVYFVSFVRNAGLPTWGDPYGHGASYRYPASIVSH
jgi:hypothetical protein